MCKSNELHFFSNIINGPFPRYIQNSGKALLNIKYNKRFFQSMSGGTTETLIDIQSL